MKIKAYLVLALVACGIRTADAQAVQDHSTRIQPKSTHADASFDVINIQEIEAQSTCACSHI